MIAKSVSLASAIVIPPARVARGNGVRSAVVRAAESPARLRNELGTERKKFRVSRRARRQRVARIVHTGLDTGHTDADSTADARPRLPLDVKSARATIGSRRCQNNSGRPE